MRVVQARAAAALAICACGASSDFAQYIPAIRSLFTSSWRGWRPNRCNHIFRTAPPDGLTIGAMTPGFVPSAVLGETGVLYDLEKTIYLGAPTATLNGFSRPARVLAPTI